MGPKWNERPAPAVDPCRRPLSGTVTTTARNDFFQACVEFRLGARQSEPGFFRRTCSPVVGNRFRITKSFQEHEGGHYELLFWLDAPGLGRMHLAGISGISVG